MAHQLAAEGAAVLVLVDWHAERLAAAATAIREKTPQVKIDSHVVDLGRRGSSMPSSPTSAGPMRRWTCSSTTPVS